MPIIVCQAINHACGGNTALYVIQAYMLRPIHSSGNLAVLSVYLLALYNRILHPRVFCSWQGMNFQRASRFPGLFHITCNKQKRVHCVHVH